MNRKLKIILISLTIAIIGAFIIFKFLTLNSKKIRNDLNKKVENKSEYAKYQIKWLLNNYTKDSVKFMYEIYLSNDSDTLFSQRKFFTNNILDTIKSDFYELKFSRIKNLNNGRVTLYNPLDKTDERKIFQRTLEASFFQYKSGNSHSISFESKNKNYVDFEFESDNDTLVGILIENRIVFIDSIVDGEEMVQITEYVYPLDNKSTTYNPFIETFKMKLLKKKR